MTKDHFNQILEARLEKTKKVLYAKADEYAREDRLHNFKRGAKVRGNGRTQAEVCLDYLTKHLVSVLDLVDDCAAGRLEKVALLKDEKIGDAINYLILLEAIFDEELEKRHDAGEEAA